MTYIYETQEFLKDAYNKGGYFCTFSKIFQVNYSIPQNQYSFQIIARKAKSDKIGYSKRGHVNKITKEMVEEFTGNNMI